MRINTALIAVTCFLSGTGVGYFSAPSHDDATLTTVPSIDAPLISRTQSPDDDRALNRTATLISPATVKTETQRRLTEQPIPIAPDHIQALAKTLPLSEILPRIEHYIGFSSEELNALEDPRRFGEKLVDIGLSGTLEPLDEEVAPPIYGPIRFYDDYPNGNLLAQFSPKQSVIYAVFDNYGYEEGAILSKWIELSTGKVHLFKKLTLHKQDENFIWLQNFNGFTPGTYRVELYRPNESLELIASGQYQVLPTEG